MFDIEHSGSSDELEKQTNLDREVAHQAAWFERLRKVDLSVQLPRCHDVPNVMRQVATIRILLWCAFRRRPPDSSPDIPFEVV